jgi:hypothetical protein
LGPDADSATTRAGRSKRELRTWSRHFAAPGPSIKYLKASTFMPEVAFPGAKVAPGRLCPRTPGGID